VILSGIVKRQMKCWGKKMSKLENIESHIFQKQDQLFLDANIWLHVYGPITARRKRSVIYSRALSDIRHACSTVFVDVLVLSEFINTFARIEYRQSASASLKFKEFRESLGFKPIAKDIAQNARRIIRQCQCCESAFAPSDIDLLLRKYEEGDSDFNDQIIAGTCFRNGLKLITDDGDFKDTGLEILTANQYLLHI
jgi:predicted nucleic acid-binding protein